MSSAGFWVKVATFGDFGLMCSNPQTLQSAGLMNLEVTSVAFV